MVCNGKIHDHMDGGQNWVAAMTNPVVGGHIQFDPLQTANEHDPCTPGFASTTTVPSFTDFVYRINHRQSHEQIESD
jgi:hypothetical protein